MLADIFTTVEQTLVDRGRHDLVTGVRVAFQDAMRHEFVATVEAHTGREVASFTSGVDIEHGVATETFILVPIPEEPAEQAITWRSAEASGALRSELKGPDGRTSCSAVRAAALAPCSPARGAATMRRAHVWPPHRG